MKVNLLSNTLNRVFAFAVVMLLSTAGWSQTSIELLDVVVPNTFTLNSTVTISGKFKNKGNIAYNGSLGLHLHVKDDMSSSEGYYYSSEIQSVGNFSLQPGEEASFSTTIYVVESLFKTSKDVVIIYPKLGNETSPSNPSFSKEVNISPSP